MPGREVEVGNIRRRSLSQQDMEHIACPKPSGLRRMAALYIEVL